jgi:hypothetical protein
MKVIALDPSGNWGREGMGTTGICIMEDGVPKELTNIKASGYESEVAYWTAVINFTLDQLPDHVCFEGYKLYHHKGMSAKTQANSELQTPQIIGVLKYMLSTCFIPYTVQFASDVKTRWSEDVLVRLGYLTHEIKSGKNFYYFNGKSAISHHRDALKHALHYWRYKHEDK